MIAVERPPKQARRSSQSLDVSSGDLGDSEDRATEEGGDSAPQTAEQAETSPLEQPSIPEEEESQYATAGAPLASDDIGPSTTATEEGSSSQSAVVAFPAQLLDILQRNVAPDALWFLEGGEAIGINRKLIDKVLNDHFRGMKFSSLVRNLNRWQVQSDLMNRIALWSVAFSGVMFCVVSAAAVCCNPSNPVCICLLIVQGVSSYFTSIATGQRSGISQPSISKRQAAPSSWHEKG